MLSIKLCRASHLHVPLRLSIKKHRFPSNRMQFSFFHPEKNKFRCSFLLIQALSLSFPPCVRVYLFFIFFINYWSACHLHINSLFEAHFSLKAKIDRERASESEYRTTPFNYGFVIACISANRRRRRYHCCEISIDSFSCSFLWYI